MYPQAGTPYSQPYRPTQYPPYGAGGVGGYGLPVSKSSSTVSWYL